MSLVYDFSFTADYAGCSATVIDSSGDEVTGSPVTLDATGKGSLSLDEGNYLAGTSNTGAAKNNAHANGVLNVPASIAAGGGGGGGGFDYTGEGSPTVAAISPDTAGAGATYLDTAHGALYIVIDFEDTLAWALVGGEIDGALDAEGVILGNGIAIAGMSMSGHQVLITDIDAYNGSGNGIQWNGTGTDGDQSFNVRVGPVGESFSAFTIYSDGSTEFRKDAYFDQTIHATGAISTKGTEPADGDINNGECSWWFDSSNGAAKVMFKGKTADGTVVEASIDMA